MNPYLKEAMDMKETLLQDRRYLHQHAEPTNELPETVAYVKARLEEMGYAPQDLSKSGVVATVGKAGGKTFLLRADMDALPMQEDSGLPFQSLNPGCAHTCGHDMHTATLLGAAKLLKEHEDLLEGQVKLMFQPDEEALTGAAAMVKAGILEGVDAAMALHVFPGPIGPGSIASSTGAMGASQDRFVITVEGHGGHGAMPHNTVDPINVGAHIVIALQEIVARELPATDPVVITVGKFQAGDAANIIPQRAVLEGTIRTLSPKCRDTAKKRLVEICELTAKTFRAECNVVYTAETAVNMNNADLVTELEGYMVGMGLEMVPSPMNMGSEDFAEVSSRIPSAYFGLMAGGDDPVYTFASNHHPKVVFNEDSLPYGVAAFVECSINWLKNNK